MFLPYSLFRVSARTEARLRVWAALLALPALAPIVVTQIAPLFLPVSFDVGRWFDPAGEGPSLFAGPWMIVLGLFLGMVGTVVGNETLKDAEFRGSHDVSTGTNTGAFGWISQLMLVCQTGAVFLLLGGILWTLAGLEVI